MTTLIKRFDFEDSGKLEVVATTHDKNCFLNMQVMDEQGQLDEEESSFEFTESEAIALFQLLTKALTK